MIKIKKIVLEKKVLEGNDTRGKQKYIVFKCTKCYQYTYAKINQKGKKCPRCGRYHKVVDLRGTIVIGSTAAMKKVKQMQNMKTGGKTPKFKSTMQSIKFSKVTDIKDGFVSSNKNYINHRGLDDDIDEFMKLVYEWQKNENISPDNGFPDYILEIIAGDLGVAPYLREKMIKRLKSVKNLKEVNPGNIFLF
ncbi:MAG: hypothetical protein ACTSWY_13810 [Promethearchaeota archaeon]